MKTFQIKVLAETEQESVENLLRELAAKGAIEFQENQDEPTPVTEDQVEEIIDEAELGPYYTEQEAKDILKL